MTYAEALHEERRMGVREGEARGEVRGRTEERIAAIKRIMQKLNLTQDEAMDFLDIPVAERAQIVAVL